MKVSLIVALARNGAIGIRNGLPWKLSSDLRRFKRLTMGHHLVMGRRTWDSVGKPLPGRINVVLTRSRDFSANGVTVVHSIVDALRLDNDEEMFIAGGAEIFAAALPYVSRAYLTIVDAEPEGDTFFPTVDWSSWNLIEREDHPADASNQYPFSFVTYERVAPSRV